MERAFRKIIFHPSDSVHDLMFAGDAGLTPSENELVAPWYFLRKRLEERGFQVVTAYEANFDLENVHRIVFLNIPDELRATPHRFFFALRRIRDKFKRITPRPYFYSKVVSAGLKDKMALMIWEPSVVIPENDRATLHQLFPRVFTWNKKYLNKNAIYRPIHWPQPIKIPTLALEEPFANRKLMVNFSGNKSSKHPFELYSARKEVIEFMRDNYPNDFDHYGPGWDGYPQWRGIARSKFEIYPKYRFGLCYENLLDEPGYITEKIFDCLRANCVPVYWGAPHIQRIIPSYSFIDRRNYSSTKDLVGALFNMSESEWLDRLASGKKYLSSDSFKEFLPDQFSKLIISGLDL